MKKIILSLLTLPLIFFSCKKSEDTKCICYVDNPLDDITWLNEAKQNFELDTTSNQSIIQFEYDNICVFVLNDKYVYPDKLEEFYDYNKNVICQFGGIAGFNTCPNFNDLATNRVVLYTE